MAERGKGFLPSSLLNEDVFEVLPRCQAGFPEHICCALGLGAAACCVAVLLGWQAAWAGSAKVTTAGVTETPQASVLRELMSCQEL